MLSVRIRCHNVDIRAEVLYRRLDPRPDRRSFTAVLFMPDDQASELLCPVKKSTERIPASVINDNNSIYPCILFFSKTCPCTVFAACLFSILSAVSRCAPVL